MNQDEARQYRLAKRAVAIVGGVVLLSGAALVGSFLLELIAVILIAVTGLSMFMVGTPKVFDAPVERGIQWRRGDRRERMKRSGSRPSEYK